MRPRNNAILVITSTRFTANDLSSAIAVAPDRSWEKGGQRGRGARHGKFAASGIEYESRVDRSLPPAEHLADVLLRLGSHLQAVVDLRECGDGDVQLRCWIYIETAEPPAEFALPPEHLAPLIAVDCEVGINVDFVGDIAAKETHTTV